MLVDRGQSEDLYRQIYEEVMRIVRLSDPFLNVDLFPGPSVVWRAVRLVAVPLPLMALNPVYAVRWVCV